MVILLIHTLDYAQQYPGCCFDQGYSRVLNSIAAAAVFNKGSMSSKLKYLHTVNALFGFITTKLVC